MKTVVMWGSIVIVATLALYLLGLFIAHRGNPDFLAIDSCLDRAGRWNYEQRACEG